MSMCTNYSSICVVACVNLHLKMFNLSSMIVNQYSVSILL